MKYLESITYTMKKETTYTQYNEYFKHIHLKTGLKSYSQIILIYITNSGTQTLKTQTEEATS